MQKYYVTVAILGDNYNSFGSFKVDYKFDVKEDNLNDFFDVCKHKAFSTIGCFDFAIIAWQKI